MKKNLFSIIILLAAFSGSQVMAQNTNDTLVEKITELKDRINGLDERVLTNESDLSKLKKIKFSGYIQAQWEKYDNQLTYPDNTFFLKRSRLKATYKASEGVAFVLQGDFIPTGFGLKDAYVQLNGHSKWNQNLSLWVGQFNKPDYEVEYSSSQRELPERSRVIRAIYPGERALGAKLEYLPKKLPLKIQLAIFNGNDNLSLSGTNSNNVNKDFDSHKDIMARATYSLKFGNLGGLDFGVNGYFGGIKATVDSTITSKYTYDKNYKLGDPIGRRWFGAEFQLFLDVLGGASIKGEFISGTNANPGYLTKTTTVSQGSPVLSGDTLILSTTTTNATTFQPNYVNKFMGYYLYFIKNLGKKNQFALRYDFYDPNTNLAGNDLGLVKYDHSSSNSVTTTSTSHEGNQTMIFKNKVVNSLTEKLSSGKSDLAYSTLTFAWQYYYNDNIRITLAYEHPMNEKTNNITADKATINGIDKMNEYNKVFNQNTITLRFQAKF